MGTQIEPIDMIGIPPGEIAPAPSRVADAAAECAKWWRPSGKPVGENATASEVFLATGRMDGFYEKVRERVIANAGKPQDQSVSDILTGRSDTIT